MRPSNKLNFTRLEFFKIIKVLGPVIYRLNLPDSTRITRIRYILVLKLIDLETSLMENILDINSKIQKKVWEIKNIINLGLINNNK